MSDPLQTTTPTPPASPPPQGQPPTPAAGQPGGQPTPPVQAAPQAPGQQPAAEQPQQPYRAFASQEELDGFVKSAKSQAERAGVRKLAKDMGFEDADEMREALQALRQAQGGGTPPAQPGATAPPATTAPSPASDTGARLQMALKVGAELNLPVALVEVLQGDSEEAMKGHAERLMALMTSGTTNRAPGIPPVPPANQPVTFTATQLKDAEFVRQNAAAIQAAAREGRIVRS